MGTRKIIYPNWNSAHLQTGSNETFRKILIAKETNFLWKDIVHDRFDISFRSGG